MPNLRQRRTLPIFDGITIDIFLTLNLRSVTSLAEKVVLTVKLRPNLNVFNYMKYNKFIAIIVS